MSSIQQPAFELSESSPRPGCLDIRVAGELDLVVADRLAEALERGAARHERVLIGLERCGFVDSTGIAVIVRAHSEMVEKGRRLSVYGLSSQVLRVFSITGLTDNGLVFESAEQALTAP